MFVGAVRMLHKMLEPIILRLSQVGEGGFAISAVSAKKIVTGADGQAHEPMFEGGLAAKSPEFLKGLQPNFLDDVLDFVLAAGVAAGRGKNAGRILLDQRLKPGRIAIEHLSDQ